MAKRELNREILGSKTLKYLSSGRLSEKTIPKSARLSLDMPEVASASPKDLRVSQVLRTSEEAIAAYRQVLKSILPKENPHTSKGSPRLLSSSTDTPKVKSSATLIGQKPSSRSNQSVFSFPPAESQRTEMNSPKAAETVRLLAARVVPDPRKSTAQETPKTRKKSEPISPLSLSSKDISTYRPATATKMSASGQHILKPKSLRQQLAPVTHNLHTAQLTSMVTQVNSSHKSSPSSSSDSKAISELLYREHLFQTYQALKFVKTLPPVDAKQINMKKLTLSRRPGFEGKKTIIFDLDETLVHCVEDVNTQSPDVILPVTFPTGEVVKVIVIQAGINIRPHLRECLLAANKDFEVMVFTASHQCYADVVLDFLDPRQELIHHRLYRDNCIQVQGVYIKDLRVIGNRALHQIVIVDNAAYSFGFQLNNGIPIISWRDDPQDQELLNLVDYMATLSVAEDIRTVNANTFHLTTFYEDYILEFLNKDEKKRSALKSYVGKKANVALKRKG